MACAQRLREIGERGAADHRLRRDRRAEPDYARALPVARHVHELGSGLID
jgi:hypothetical protein